LYRHRAVDAASNQPVALERAQRLRQHLLRYAGDAPQQLRIAQRLFAQCENDEHRPFARDAVEDLLRGALRIQDVVDGIAHTRFLVESTFWCLLRRHEGARCPARVTQATRTRVSQRTHEIGVRMALGARRSDVVRFVALQSSRAVIAGLILGGAAAFVASRWIADMLYQTSPHDPVVYGVAAVVLALASVVASVVPVRRSTAVDPAQAIRTD
jgi:predicted lysophospholipase L1 biosynthesis ABC-type transport system permease subunit